MENAIKFAETEHGKVAVYVRPDGGADCISATILGGTFWDGPLLLPFYDKWSDPKKVAIEVGAFAGQGALYLSKRNRHVIAVEPIHFGLTNATVAINGLKNVTVLAGAAYSEGTWMKLAADEEQGQVVNGLEPGDIDNPGGVALVRASKADAESQECIQGFVLDKWVEEEEEVGLIKVDAQGCDLRVLVGLRKTIERCRPGILFEYEANLAKLHGDLWKEYVLFFDGIGYTLKEQDEAGYARNFVAVPE